MKLYAIGDLHLAFKPNRDALDQLQPHPGDGLILCGDIGECADQLELAFAAAKRNFAEVWWCPGNHELYSIASQTNLRGEAKYNECLEIARQHGVHTPEDEYFRWEGEGGPALVAPLFTLYDYSFRPGHLKTKEEAIEWAAEADTVATDEFLLHPDPHPSREAWCDALITKTEARLIEASREGIPIIIANHWPLREDLIFIPRVPRFVLWCGSKRTEDWHTKYNAKVVVSGHLHVPRTIWKDGVRFEEVSLGYPRQWEDPRKQGKDINHLMREILPGPTPPESGFAPPQFRRWG